LKPRRYSCARVWRKVFCSPIVNFKIGDLRFFVGTADPKLGALLITSITPTARNHAPVIAHSPFAALSYLTVTDFAGLRAGPLRESAQHPVPAIFAHDPAFKLDPSNRLTFPANLTGL
jgi:hypothetical protein